MTVLPENAQELAVIAGEVGAVVLRGILRYPSKTGGWQLGDLDLDEYLARYRNQKLVLIIAPVSEAEPMTFTCGICGFVYAEYGECLRCRMQVEEAAHRTEFDDILDQVVDLLGGEGRNGSGQPGGAMDNGLCFNRASGGRASSV